MNTPEEWKKNFDFYFEPVKNVDSLKDKIILEVGCGKGRHTFYASKIAKEVIAVDFGRSIDVALLNNKNKQGLVRILHRAQLKRENLG